MKAFRRYLTCDTNCAGSIFVYTVIYNHDYNNLIILRRLNGSLFIYRWLNQKSAPKFFFFYYFYSRETGKCVEHQTRGPLLIKKDFIKLNRVPAGDWKRSFSGGKMFVEFKLIGQPLSKPIGFCFKFYKAVGQRITKIGYELRHVACSIHTCDKLLIIFNYRKVHKSILTKDNRDAYFRSVNFGDRRTDQ